jgi:hypothetical protein
MMLMIRVYFVTLGVLQSFPLKKSRPNISK